MNLDKLIKELTKKYGKDERVIRSIVNSPFLFAKRSMMSLEDERPIRIPRWGTFKLRSKRGKYIAKLMLLNKTIKKLMTQYAAEDTPAELKVGILHAVNTMLQIIDKEGYSNEQSVQYIIKWKNRAEAGDVSDSPIRSNMGEGQDKDEGPCNNGD